MSIREDADTVYITIAEGCVEVYNQDGSELHTVTVDFDFIDSDRSHEYVEKTLLQMALSPPAIQDLLGDFIYERVIDLDMEVPPWLKRQQDAKLLRTLTEIKEM